MRVGVVAEVQTRVDPLLQQRDASGIDRSVRLKLSLVDESDRRDLVPDERGDQVPRHALGLCDLVSSHGNRGEIVDRDRHLARLPFKGGGEHDRHKDGRPESDRHRHHCIGAPPSAAFTLFHGCLTTPPAVPLRCGQSVSWNSLAPVRGGGYDRVRGLRQSNRPRWPEPQGIPAPSSCT
jgi:hypothetical protein